MRYAAPTPPNIDAVAKAVRHAKKILILDYRSEDGLYKNAHIFSTRFFYDPSKYEEVIRICRSLYDQARDCEPTETHRFIAKLKDQNRLVRCYTQNVDRFEERVGLKSDLSSKSVECVPLHGTVHRLRCRQCCFTCGWDTLPLLPFPEKLACPGCSSNSAMRRDGGYLRKKSPGYLLPDIVLLDEPLHREAQTIGQLSTTDSRGSSDLLLILGTSLRVDGPLKLARTLAKAVRSRGGEVIYVNSDPPKSHVNHFVDHPVRRLCDEWVNQLDIKDRPSSNASTSTPPPAYSSSPSEEVRQKDLTEAVNDCVDRGAKGRKRKTTSRSDGPNHTKRQKRKRSADLAGLDIIVIDDEQSSPTDPKQPRPLFHLHEEQLSTLQGNYWVDDAVIFAFSRIVEYVVGPDLVRIVDPLGVRNKREGWTRATSAVILLPFQINENHWVVARIRPFCSMIDIFDSLPSYGNRDIARSKAESFYKREINRSSMPNCSYSAPLLQENSSDCGVAVMVMLLYLAFGLQIEAGADFAGCRRMFSDLLRDASSQKDVPVITESNTILVPEEIRSVAHKQSISVADFGQMLESFTILAQETAIRLGKEKTMWAKSVDWAHKARVLIQHMMQKSEQMKGAQARDVNERLSRAEAGLREHINSARIYELEDIISKASLLVR